MFIASYQEVKMSKLVLVAGATGYVATRLIPSLLSKGFRVRCLVRSTEKLRNRPWREKVEVVVGDVMNKSSLYPALKNVDTAFYLIHNMASGSSYQENERIGARNFGRIARFSGVQHIIFLGGLGGSKDNRHMKSRQETGRLLRESGVAVTEFRSSIIIGSGSISFELIRYLTAWFPVIPAPAQTDQPGQPIGITDLLNLLIAAVDDADCRGQILEIGGPEVIHYPDILQQFARIKGLRRPRLRLPFFPVSLSARIADRLTPVPYEIAYPLMQELEAPSVVQGFDGNPIQNKWKALRPYADSVKYALRKEEHESGAPLLGSLVTRGSLTGNHVRTSGEGFLIDHREADREKPVDLDVESIRGKLNNKWKIDGFVAGQWIRIRREYPSFGDLIIETHCTDGRVIQTALFEPRGLAGFLYWYCLLPFHSRNLNKKFMELLKND